MSASAPVASIHSSHAARMAVSVCSISGVLSTAQSFTSRARKMTKVSPALTSTTLHLANSLPLGPSPGALSPGGAPPQTHTLNPPPPLLRLAASPHDSHLLATFAADSKILRILDHRQPGQALLELHGHSANINCVEWSPNRRGILASGGDDSQVLYWDLVNPGQSAAVVPGSLGGQQNGMGGMMNMLGSPVGGQSSDGAAGVGSVATPSNAKGPAAAWRSDLEVGNVSWSPRNAGGSEWVGVTGGRAVWGVRV